MLAQYAIDTTDGQAVVDAPDQRQALIDFHRSATGARVRSVTRLGPSHPDATYPSAPLNALDRAVLLRDLAARITEGPTR